MKNTIKLQTISLNGVKYTRTTGASIDTDVYDVDNFISLSDRRYYANKFNVRGVSKSIRSIVN